MADLRVNTDIIRKASSALSNAATSMQQVVSRINIINGQIRGEYQGQLREKVNPIISSASGDGSRLQSRSAEQSAKLSTKAKEIDDVMQGSVNQIATESASSTWSGSSLQTFFNKIGKLGVGIGAFIVGLVGFKPSSVNSTKITTTSSTPPPASNTTTPLTPNTTGANGPIQGVTPVLTQGVHLSGDSKDGKRGVAIDIGTVSPDKAEVHNLLSGKVVDVGPDLDDKGNLHDYGNYIKVLQDDGKVVLYAHLRDQPADIKPGDRIDQNETIGMMGSTGRSTGPHLHLEFREAKFNDKGNYIGDSTGLVTKGFDPYKYLAEIGTNPFWP